MLFVIKVKKNIIKIMKNIIKTLDIYNEIHYNIIKKETTLYLGDFYEVHTV